MSKQTPAQWNTSIASPMTGTTHEVCVVHGVPTQPTEDGLGQGYIYIGANKPCFEVDKAEQLSNAHLIAAAPELLEACKEVLLQFSSTPKMGADNDYGDPCYASSHDKMMGVALTQVQAAIAKAEGKS